MRTNTGAAKRVRAISRAGKVRSLCRPTYSAAALRTADSVSSFVRLRVFAHSFSLVVESVERGQLTALLQKIDPPAR